MADAMVKRCKLTDNDDCRKTTSKMSNWNTRGGGTLYSNQSGSSKNF